MKSATLEYLYIMAINLLEMARKIAEAARAGLAIEKKRLNEILANRKKESVHPSR
jgi:hypothetical protein